MSQLSFLDQLVHDLIRSKPTNYSEDCIRNSDITQPITSIKRNSSSKTYPKSITIGKKDSNAPSLNTGAEIKPKKMTHKSIENASYTFTD